MPADTWLSQETYTDDMMEEMQAFISLLQSLSNKQLALLLVIAQVIRFRLATIPSIPSPAFPSTSKPSPDEALATRRFLVHIRKMTEIYETSGNEGNATGARVWQHTARALAFPELHFLGAALWHELRRGAPGVRREFENLRAQGSSLPEMTDEELRFIPPLLVL